MTYTGLELFMDNLKLLGYSNDNPLIINNPQILTKRPQIQRLYQELSFMIQIMFIEKKNSLHESEQVKNLKTRFKDVAQEAHSIVGLYVYAINYINTTGCGFDYKSYRNLENVMRDIKSIREEIMSLDGLKIDSSPSIKVFKTQTVAGTSHAKNLIGMKKVSEEIVVGLERDAELIRDKLAEDQKQLDVVSIVGMGGVGKTTLATKVYNDPFVVYHFHVRAWVTVSQTSERRDFLIQLLQSIGTKIGTKFDLESESHSELRKKLHKTLMGRRYLIVIDDIWSTKAWDDLKLFFPNNSVGSRVLLTSRLRGVALHAKSDGLIHQLECLTDKESLELMCKKVFHGSDCPESLIGPGMKIAKNCHGLPLAVVVIAGVLANVEAHKDSWEKIASSVSSYIVSNKTDKNGQLDILDLSYEHLPPHLKDCFLYLSGFPEDHKFRVRKLIWLWIAEGFVVEDGNRSLEEIGEDYLMELVERNLVLIIDRKCNGAVKACSVHDLLRELCLERATKRNFCVKINMPLITYHLVQKYKPRRIFTNMNFLIRKPFDQPSLFLGEVQSLLCFATDYSFDNNTNIYFHHYPLLTVLDLQQCLLKVFPQDIGWLVHLRYLAFWCNGDFPPFICDLWNLQTVIVRSYGHVSLPKAISNLVNLRHLCSEGRFLFPAIEKPVNLQTISEVVLDDVDTSWEKCFPTIKKLTCITSTHKNKYFKSLNFLETLYWISSPTGILQFGKFSKIDITFPASLKKLSLSGGCLPWSDMLVIQSLLNLEVLNILIKAFWGPKWETGEVQFQKLEFLKLQCLNIQQWEASSINFPCLKSLVLDKCKYLKEIPLEIGDIATLKLIDIDDSRSSVVHSLDEIRKEQKMYGNCDLKINVRKQIRIIVGLDRDFELIRDKLVEDKKQLDVVSIVGMGGLGKTKLATTIFNDPYVNYHFHVRAWVTVSQTYESRHFLIQILQSIGTKFNSESESHSELREKLHNTLMGVRYLIVVDDIWSTKAWDDLKRFFPKESFGSRVLLTSRLTQVALHANPSGLIHQLECLTDEESWELLCKKVFYGNDCPESLLEPGMKIARNCHGLPLAVVVIAGVLAKVEAYKDSWENIAQSVSSYIFSDKNALLDILGYEHLPPHLKDCFLYLSRFPEGHKFRVRKLIWLWIAEGFVQEDGNRSLEEIGEDYMVDLVDRNLVLVVKRKFNGAIKDCSVHYLLRDLCLEIARKENIWLKTNPPITSLPSGRQYMPYSIFKYSDNTIKNSFDLQSLLCFNFLSNNYPTQGYFHYYSLLTVLDLQKCRLEVFPWDLELLVHLRYLAFWYIGDFPSSICNIRSLHTVIARSSRRLYLPKAISNMVNLKHLWSEGGFKLPVIEKPMNLQTISDVALDDDAESWEKCFPVIKKLTCTTSTHKNQSFNSLNSLETLTWINTASGGPQAGDRVLTSDGKFQKIHVTFPMSLKKLSLRGCRLHWSDISVIQSLPNLEVLKLLESAFQGPKWETGEAQFPQLTLLMLEGLDIRQWEASWINFPCLKHLVLDKCKDLEEIPIEIGEVSTLQLIDVDNSSSSVVDSLDKLRKEQQCLGNYDLIINVRRESHRPKHLVLDKCKDLEDILLATVDIRELSVNDLERRIALDNSGRHPDSDPFDFFRWP